MFYVSTTVKEDGNAIFALLQQRKALVQKLSFRLRQAICAVFVLFLLLFATALI
ncbi:MAG: hypothetical protein IJ881_01255 [Neisseriaceae bacterium]|nr:hypothetical protein [Neisseriaceae bacterium]MBR3425894.1 hypothetical protein [Neisseriaceae bacterium]